MTHLPNMFWMVRRYLASRRNHYASFVNWVSFAGLALGVMVLTVVVSVMNGFDRELKNRLLGAVPHALVFPPPDWDFEANYVPAASDRILHVARVFQGPAMISRDGAATALALLGVDQGGVDGLDLIADSIVQGSLDALFEDEGGIMLGAPLARALGLAVGDPVALVLMVSAENGARPRVERFTLRATFEVGAAPDASLALVRFDDIERRGLVASGAAGWRIAFADPMDVPEIEADLRAGLPPGWRLTTWIDNYGELFRAVGLEKTLMFVSLALVVAIAAFNIVSGQTMLVNEKRRDIAMLTTIGAPSRFLVEVFLVQGFSVARDGDRRRFGRWRPGRLERRSVCLGDRMADRAEHPVGDGFRQDAVRGPGGRPAGHCGAIARSLLPRGIAAGVEGRGRKSGRGAARGLNFARPLRRGLCLPCSRTGAPTFAPLLPAPQDVQPPQ